MRPWRSSAVVGSAVLSGTIGLTVGGLATTDGALLCCAIGVLVLFAITVSVVRLQKAVRDACISSHGRPLVRLCLIHISIGLAFGMATGSSLNLLAGLALGPMAAALVTLSLAAWVWRLCRQIPLTVGAAALASSHGHVIRGRSEICTLLAILTADLTPKDEVLVTSLEEAPVDYIEENEPSRRFMDAWHAKARDGVRIKQVVRVFDHPEDMANLDGRVERAKLMPNVELGVIFAPPPEPLLDIYLVQGRYAVISFSTSAATPSLMTDSIILTDREAITSVAAFFKETLWARAEPLKTMLTVEMRVLDDLRRANQTLRRLGNTRIWREIPSLVARGGSVSRDMLDLFAAFREASSFLELRPDDPHTLGIRQRLQDLSGQLRRVQIGSHTEFATAFHALLGLEPKEMIEAVSPFDNELYWLSTSGVGQMQFETELAARGVTICRIFIVPAALRLSDAMRGIIDRQRSYAGTANILVVDRAEIQAATPEGVLIDFAIIDRRLAMNDASGVVRIDDDLALAARLRQNFSRLHEVATTKAQRDQEDTMTLAEELVRTVTSIDLVGYSIIARTLEENIGSSAVAALNADVQRFVDIGLSAAAMTREEAILATTGDGAILIFQPGSAIQRFAEAVLAAADEHNRNAKEPLAKREFRIGAWTGSITVKRQSGRVEAAGIAIANAVRLESAGRHGDLLVDTTTFGHLTVPEQAAFAAPESVPGKRNETFTVRRRQILADAAPIAGKVHSPTPATALKRRDIAQALKALEADQFNILLFLMEVPVDHQPSMSLNLADRKAALLSGLREVASLERLGEELGFLLEGKSSAI